jgi:uncharacterized protein YbjQ (UPF0145 family)
LTTLGVNGRSHAGAPTFESRGARLPRRGGVGGVFGLTVRSRNLGAQIGAGLKSLGRRAQGMTKMLAEGRMHAQQRLEEEAPDRGADAVLAFRFDTSELGGT